MRRDQALLVVARQAIDQATFHLPRRAHRLNTCGIHAADHRLLHRAADDRPAQAVTVPHHAEGERIEPAGELHLFAATRA